METVFVFLVSILVRKPSQIKWFPHFLRSAEKVQMFCSRMTKRTPACLESRRGFCVQELFCGEKAWYTEGGKIEIYGEAKKLIKCFARKIVRQGLLI